MIAWAKKPCGTALAASPDLFTGYYSVQYFLNIALLFGIITSEYIAVI